MALHLANVPIEVDDMQEQLRKRLNELKAQYESGQKMIEELDTKQANLRATLLRISGAIQVLEEELNKPAGQPHGGLSDPEVEQRLSAAVPSKPQAVGN
jgi:uncharacterized coiled-coil DUF342 family protein